MPRPLQSLRQHPLVLHRSSSALTAFNATDATEVALQEFYVFVVNNVYSFVVESLSFAKICHNILKSFLS